jgi:adenosylcobinamide kinase/adenosylcobinamide-phosphate guanylyltransferase
MRAAVMPKHCRGRRCGLVLIPLFFHDNLHLLRALGHARTGLRRRIDVLWPNFGQPSFEPSGGRRQPELAGHRGPVSMTTRQPLSIARSELILGGQKSGMSGRAEPGAGAGLAAPPHHRAVLIATAQPWDEEMRQRIARHQQDRAERVPGMVTVEEPRALGEALARHSRVDTLVVVDCLTLWLTNCWMPMSADSEANVPVALVETAQAATFLGAIAHAKGPVVLVGNEIGLGVIPMGAQVRAFVDALGLLNQTVAATCQRVTLMAAGLPLTLKDDA